MKYPSVSENFSLISSITISRTRPNEHSINRELSIMKYWYLKNALTNMLLESWNWRMQAHIEALHHAGVSFGFKAPITLKSNLALKIIEFLDAKSLKSIHTSIILSTTLTSRRLCHGSYFATLHTTDFNSL